MSKYPRIKDGEPYQLDTTKYILRFACCDCGMVHDFVFNICPDNRTLVYTISQRPRSTAQLRSHKHGDLHGKDKKWFLTRHGE